MVHIFDYWLEIANEFQCAMKYTYNTHHSVAFQLYPVDGS